MSAQQLQTLIDLIRSSPPLGDGDVAAMRASAEAMGAMLPVDPQVVLEPAPIGTAPAEWASAPEADPARAVLYLHGGGYASGSIAVYRSLSARLSRASAAKVLTVEYRLAPEHPFPAGLDDALAAYDGLLQAGFAPERIVVAGDSAGGGLAAALLLVIRDCGRPAPAGAVLLSPLLDLAATGESMITKAAEDPMVSAANVRATAARYLGPDGDLRSPLASPLYADLKGLPPLLIQVGTAECLLDDARRFADRARDAGVVVDLEVWDDMIHVWQVFAAILDEGQSAIDAIGRFVQAKAG
jgi:monoterpene epsilon-lactone hydrolase